MITSRRPTNPRQEDRMMVSWRWSTPPEFSDPVSAVGADDIVVVMPFYDVMAGERAVLSNVVDTAAAEVGQE
jgi:hypothetical protein